MSASQWNDSEPSDHEVDQDQFSSRKRSSRACDQCRRTKSKCEPSHVPGSCRSCAVSGNTCTFLGPSYKRGPPKGYIQAIEQRWHQVEALLGAIIACSDSRVQNLLTEIREDDLAREILDRVDTGPFGPSGRLTQATGATKEDFLACIFRSNEGSVREASRLRRQSRMSREIVSKSSGANSLSTFPTTDWQDRLTARLTRSALNTEGTSRLSQSPSFPSDMGPVMRRARVDEPVIAPTPRQPNWNEMYTMEALSESDDVDESRATTAFGQLSLDENQEIRYHGKASGLHLLSRSDRLDKRNEGGVWRLPMARFWPSTKANISYDAPENDINVMLPPPPVQDQLVNLYFSYAHPMFPVIHKGRFLREWSEWKRKSNPATPEASGGSSSPQPEPSQTLTKLLLLSMFAVAARYLDRPNPGSTDKLWENTTCGYFLEAKNILAQVYQSCRATTCQALLLLGHREFGIGSMEQGWLYIGMAIRMALDLGLNRSADNWQCNGKRMFSAEENQVRKQIWWACCIADKYTFLSSGVRPSLIFDCLGRPVCISENDYDTLFPDAEEYEDEGGADLVTRQPFPTVLVMQCFRAAASLSVIIGSISSQIYPVKATRRGSRRAILRDLEARLDQWYHQLPDGLSYDPASKRAVPPPPILFIHVKYWSAVLLLHRAFIPNWNGSESDLYNKPSNSDTTTLKAFDLCQSAATYISNIVTTYRENFDIKNSTPFLSSYLLSAGIMHILTLTLFPSNVQAYIGLRQLLAALQDMQGTWPSMGRTWDLLNGAKVKVDSNLLRLEQNADRQKRGADDAFGREKRSGLPQQEVFTDSAIADFVAPTGGIQDISTCMMARMLGLDIPGIDPSASYHLGYEMWPQATFSNPQSHLQPPFANISPQGTLPPLYYQVNRLDQEWESQASTPVSHQYTVHGPFSGYY
ncbi:fungal-specific transcription factor domain-containing protein [Pisolithus croceorrhizus]|nr:fungal-specific transcription factor domain-containing protein [Pisolithus croceorrhizus]